jgi:hypothetical protein
MGSDGLQPDLPPEHRLGSDVVSGIHGLFPQHEGAWGFGPRHGGGGCFLRQRWSAGLLWLDHRISRSGI